MSTEPLKLVYDENITNLLYFYKCNTLLDLRTFIAKQEQENKELKNRLKRIRELGKSGAIQVHAKKTVYDEFKKLIIFEE